MQIIGHLFSNETSDFIAFGIAETTEKENGETKINFYNLSSKENDFKFLDSVKVAKIHDLLKKFGSYQDVLGSENKNIMGLKRCYVTGEIWENIKMFLDTKKS